MKKSLIYMLMLISSLKYVKAESCYFDFEQADELQNFDFTCNGIIGDWSIVPTPTIPSLDFETGDSALTSAKDKIACMATAKKIDLPENLKITADFFVQIVNYYDSIEVSLALMSVTNSDKISEIKIYGPDLVPNGDGVWKRETGQFTNPAGEYRIVINMYRNSDAIVLLDKILLENLPSDDCYVVPKPTTTTTELTTITTELTTITTEATTITTEQTTVTTEPTTIATEITTITTEQTTVTTEQTTITTESTTLSTDPTTPTTEPTTLSTDATTIATELTTISTLPTSIATESPVNSTESTDFSNEVSTDTTTESQTTIDPTTSYPGFSFFYIVIIIAASGCLILLSACVTFIILRKGRSKRKTRRRRYETYA